MAHKAPPPTEGTPEATPPQEQPEAAGDAKTAKDTKTGSCSVGGGSTLDQHMHSRVHAALLILVFNSFACSGDTSTECVEVDEKLADPPSRSWCDGEYSPPPWNGRPADKTLGVCLPAQPDGSCKLCPRAEVIDDVETKVHEIAEERECALEHWEFGCMRTVENGKLISIENNYCCYQVALWGSGCKDDP